MQDKKPTKIFEDFPQVDCNECSRYWDNSCDGVSKAQKRPCNSFLATRSVVLPQKIKALEKEILRLRVACILLSVCTIMLGVSQIIHLLGG